MLFLFLFNINLYIKASGDVELYLFNVTRSTLAAQHQPFKSPVQHHMLNTTCSVSPGVHGIKPVTHSNSPLGVVQYELMGVEMVVTGKI